MKNKPAIILVSPQLGENIGAAARVMLNFGIDDLRLVTPRDGWPNPKAVDMAKGAKKVIENARVFESLADATFDINHLYATTARTRDMIKPTLTAKKTAQDIISHSNSGERSAIMFGPERTGLENEHITLAEAITYIPVAPEYTSLNLAQAVSITCYEWFSAGDDTPEQIVDIGNLKQASKEELAHLFKHLESELDNTDFFKLPDKRPKMVNNIRNIFSRANLTDQEVRTLRGIIRSLVTKH